MACFTPMTFTVPMSKFSRLSKDVKVPCNYCLSCRVTRSIYLRSIASFDNYLCALDGRGSTFATLTYDDYNLPVSLDSGLPTLSRVEIQNFIKRFRASLPKDLQSCKVMYSGEYGDEFGRPHYHFTALGVPSSYAQPAIYNAWNNPDVVDFTGVIRGLIDVGTLRAGGLSYVTKYCLKQVRGKEVSRLYSDNFVEPPFIGHSINLEKQFILRELDELRSSGWKNTFFGRPSFIPAKVMKKYATDYEVKKYQVECIRYLKSKPMSEIVNTRYAKERSLYFNNINSGKAADNDVLNWNVPDFF